MAERQARGENGLPTTACVFDSHRGWECTNRHGVWVCAVCHPPARKGPPAPQVLSYEDLALMATWRGLGQPPIPVAFNERNEPFSSVVDLVRFFAAPRYASPHFEERREAARAGLAARSANTVSRRSKQRCLFE